MSGHRRYREGRIVEVSEEDTAAVRGRGRVVGVTVSSDMKQGAITERVWISGRSEGRQCDAKSSRPLRWRAHVISM